MEASAIGSVISDLDPGTYGVVVSDADAFELRYGPNVNVLGKFEGTLDNGGESISLSVVNVRNLADVVYGDNDPWPQAPDGAGASLELNNDSSPKALFSKYYTWRSSHEYGGSPGRQGAAPIGVVINEVLSRTDRADAIELLNTTDAAIEVGAGTSVIHARTSGSTELMMELSLRMRVVLRSHQ